MGARGLVRAVGVAVVCAAAACSGSSADVVGGGDAGTSGGDGGAGGDGAAGYGDDGGSFADGALSGDGGARVGEVWAHSATALYKLEPFSHAVTTVGTFDCVTPFAGPLPCGDGMWDLAVDESGTLYGTAAKANDVLCTASKVVGYLVRIDKTTAHCTIVQTSAPGTKYPNSLTFVPAGVLDPSKEVLVGYVNGASGADYMQIDLATGAQTKIGGLDPNPTGSTWWASGDVVSIKGGKTYLTAKPSASPSYAGNDTLLEIDPKTGQALAVVGSDTGFPQLWGLGFWAGTAYGFSATGQLCGIDLTTGKGTAIPLTGLPAGLAFWGAGATTIAPLEPPK